jgi:hypothetical protein
MPRRPPARNPDRTPYVLLLSFPGVNVVSAADYAGEMGPIEHYAHSRTITGRAGLRPSRYQSDLVDKASGPLVRCCNRKRRAAILRVADNLIKCNHHFNSLAHRGQAEGKAARRTRVKVALRFVRIAYQIVAGRQVFRHPCLQAGIRDIAISFQYHLRHSGHSYFFPISFEYVPFSLLSMYNMAYLYTHVSLFSL